jgi:hypothetical protein
MVNSSITSRAKFSCGRVRVLALDSTVHANEGAFSLHEIEARVGQRERERERETMKGR